MPYEYKPKKVAFKGVSNEARKRHTGSAAAKKLIKGSHVSAHSSTHMKSRMKRY